MEMSESKAKSGYRFPQWNFISLMILAILMKGSNLIDAKLNIIPHDTEVRINDSTYFNCSTSLIAGKVQWRHGNFYVYTGIILEPYNDGRFLVEINASTGASNLVIRSVHPSDAGSYECLEDEGFGEKKTAELIVIDRDPVCKSMHLHGVIGPNSCGIEPEEVRLSCSLKYHGKSLPVLQWQASDDNQSISDGRLNITSINNEVNYMLTMKSSLTLNNASFICQTTRTSDKHYSCSHSTIQILYVFNDNVTINMTMNDEVSCFANTSQLCSYKWKWLNNDDISTESDDHILKPKRVGWHRCEATCSFGGKSCIVNPLYANVYSDKATKGQNLMLFVLLLVPAFAAIGVITYCWREKRRKKEKRNVPRKDERMTSSYDVSESTITLTGANVALDVMKPIVHKVLTDDETLQNKLTYIKNHMGAEKYMIALSSMPIGLREAPEYWYISSGQDTEDEPQVTNSSDPKRILLVKSSRVYSAVELLVKDTWNPTRGSALSGINVSNIWIVVNQDLFTNYLFKLKNFASRAAKRPFKTITDQGQSEIITKTVKGTDFIGKHLVSEVNETYLFHGTIHVDEIEKTGIDSRFCGKFGYYGRGAYFAESSTKSDLYAKSHSNPKAKRYMFVARVLLGEPFLCTKPDDKLVRAPADGHRMCDSVFGTPMDMREFVIYNPEQSYPEFLVEYNTSDNCFHDNSSTDNSSTDNSSTDNSSPDIWSNDNWSTHE